MNDAGLAGGDSGTRPPDREARGPLAVDRLLAGYLALTGALALLSLRPAGLAAAALHALAIGTVLAAGRLPLPARRWIRFLRAAYPVLLTPLLYMELSFLNQLLVDGYLDALVQAWEEALFGLQPSLEAGLRLRRLWVSELLHVGYFAYYGIVPLALVGVFVTRGARELHDLAFQTALAFFASYTVFLIFPVTGPRYLFPRLPAPASEGTWFALVHAVLEGGSSKGTAFPSSHVAASWAAVLACWRADRRWFWLLAAPALALALGTVYGRFHYAIDAAAGVVLAVAVHAAAPGLRARMGGAPAPPRSVRGA